MRRGAHFEIPHGSLFEVRIANGTIKSFGMLIQNPDEKNKGFRTCGLYQKSPIYEPKYMCGWNYVSIYADKENPVRMRLRAGLRYQKIIGGAGLVDPEGNAFIETLERDMEAYLSISTQNVKTAIASE